MKAISIDPFAKHILEIELQPDSQEDVTDAICKALSCEWIKAAMSFPNGDFLYVKSVEDKETNNLAFSIMVNGICVPFIGPGIIVGCDIVNELDTDTHFTADLIKPLVRFYDSAESLFIKNSDLTVFANQK